MATRIGRVNSWRVRRARYWPRATGSGIAQGKPGRIGLLT